MLRFKVLKATAWIFGFAAVIVAVWAVKEAFVEGNVEFVNVFAGSAAVITAAISAIIALYSIELTEEKLRPYPYPYFVPADHERGFCYFEIQNVGETTAHDIYLEWTGNFIPKSGIGDNPAPLMANGKENAISMLLPHESISQPWDVLECIVKQADAEGSEWKGYINFKDPMGRKYRIPFVFDINRRYQGQQ